MKYVILKCENPEFVGRVVHGLWRGEREIPLHAFRCMERGHLRFFKHTDTGLLLRSCPVTNVRGIPLVGLPRYLENCRKGLFGPHRRERQPTVDTANDTPGSMSADSVAAFNYQEYLHMVQRLFGRQAANRTPPQQQAHNEAQELYRFLGDLGQGFRSTSLGSFLLSFQTPEQQTRDAARREQEWIQRHRRPR